MVATTLLFIIVVCLTVHLEVPTGLEQPLQ